MSKENGGRTGLIGTGLVGTGLAGTGSRSGHLGCHSSHTCLQTQGKGGGWAERDTRAGTPLAHEAMTGRAWGALPQGSHSTTAAQQCIGGSAVQ